MQSVKVRRGGITADGAAEVLRSELAGGYEIKTGDDGTVQVRKGLARAKVSLRTEPGGTVFDVSGEGAMVFPLIKVISKMVNENGIAKRTASAIGGAAAFRDDG